MNDRDCDNCAHHSEGGCSVWECSFERKKDDLISRRAAIDAICGECQANCIPCESFPCGEIKVVQALPSAQPDLQQTCNQLATDTISRQDAIDVIMDYPHGDVWNVENMDNMVCEIKALPSAQSDLITQMQNGIKATDADDAYSCGIRNGMRWCISLIDDKEPLYEKCPPAQPEIVRCKDCKYVGTDATCCLVCDREGMGLRPFHVRKDDYCSYAEVKNVENN